MQSSQAGFLTYCSMTRKEESLIPYGMHVVQNGTLKNPITRNVFYFLGPDCRKQKY